MWYDNARYVLTWLLTPLRIRRRIERVTRRAGDVIH